MNSVHRKHKSTNGYGNSAKCLVWCGTPNVALEPLLARNLIPNVYYSVNKKNRWDIEEELTNWISPYHKWAHFCDKIEAPISPWDEAETGWYTVGRVTHKRNHNVIQVEQVCTEEPDAEWFRPRKTFPKRRAYHRDHHRPTVTQPPPEKGLAGGGEKDAAFVVFPHSVKSPVETVGHRHKVIATNRGSRGRKQGRRVKHAWQSTKLIHELRNDSEEVETEIRTDDEYEQALRTFTYKIEQDQLIDLEEQVNDWPDDGFPWFEDWPDTPTSGYETDDFQPITLEIQSTNPCTWVPQKSNKQPLEQRGILTQLEHLLCHNKTTLEYLQNAVERAQELALWKYLEFLAAPFDGENVSLRSADGTKVTTYSIPASTTYTSTWCTQAATPWTMVSDHTNAWVTDERDSWCLDRFSAVDQWTANGSSHCQPAWQVVRDIYQSRPDVRLEEIPKKTMRSKKVNIPKQLFYFPPGDVASSNQSDHQPTREQFVTTENPSTDELDDRLTFIHLLFDMDEKRQKNLLNCEPMLSSNTSMKPKDVKAKPKEEVDEALTFIRDIFRVEEIETRKPVQWEPTGSNVNSTTLVLKKKWNLGAQDEALFALRFLFKEEAPSARKTVSRSTKKRYLKKKLKREHDSALKDVGALFAQERTKEKTNKSKNTESKQNFIHKADLGKPSVFLSTLSDENDDLAGVGEDQQKSDSDWIREAEILEQERDWTIPSSHYQENEKAEAMEVETNEPQEPEAQQKEEEGIEDTADGWVIVDLYSDGM